MNSLMKQSATPGSVNQRCLQALRLRGLSIIALVLGFSMAVSAQSLSWVTPSSIGVTIGGVSGRESPGAAAFNGSMYVAYTSTVSGGDYDNNYVYVGSGTGLSYSGFGYINPSGGIAESNSNPSLVAFNGKLWLAFNAAGATGTENADIVSYDGTSWGIVTGLPVGSNVAYSPSLATDGTYLYVGLMDAGSKAMILCKGDGVNPFTCQNFASALPDELGYNPGLAYYNGVLYAGWVTNDNDHDMYYYTSTNQGASFTKSSALDGNQSSCAPHLGVHNNVLWFDVRTNDDAHKFSQRYTTNGTSWSSGADAHIAMEGEPTVTDGAPLSIYNQYFYLFFASNDGTNTLNVTYGN